MTEPKQGTGHCDLCREDVPSMELLDHIRVMHPDHYERPLTWPDGQHVIIEELEPSDFDPAAEDQ